jgi:hypothetical protein
VRALQHQQGGENLMARIRSIKPEFWTDEKIVQLPFEARLLFIGMWNFADDHGLLYDEPERIRLQVLPGDHIDSADLVDLLVAADLVERYEAQDGRRFLAIKRFAEHQKVDHPSKSKIHREGSRKLAIPQAARRAVATKYGCEPGETKDVTCYCCGAPGVIHWWRLANGRPSAWVSFTLEIDHFEAESAGGAADPSNLVLACRPCNRSKKDREAREFLTSPREGSRGLAPDQGRDQGRDQGDAFGAQPSAAPDRPPLAAVPDPEPDPEPNPPASPDPDPGPDPEPPPVTAQTLTAEFVDKLHARGSPVAKREKGQAASQFGALLADGFTPEQIRAGTDDWLARDQHVSTLTSFVSARARRGRPRAGPSSGGTAFDHLRRRYADAKAREEQG